jgi:ankyrin repeat protein
MIDKSPSNPDRNRDLFFAAMNGDAVVAERLLKAGADPNTRQPRFEFGQPVPALYAAADAGARETAALLVKHGAKIDAGTPEGRSPLMAAVSRGDAKLAALLIDAGAKTSVRYGPDTLLDMAEKCDKPQPLLRLLLEKFDGEKLNETLLEAARNARPALIECALALGADVHATDPTGNTALVLAAQNHEKPAEGAAIVRLLLKHGAEVDAENDLKETALSAALMRRPVPEESVLALVDAGADITRDTLAGLTVYEAAQLAENERILPCFESARKQNILREVKKYYEGTGNKITVRKPFNPRPPG